MYGDETIKTRCLFSVATLGTQFSVVRFIALKIEGWYSITSKFSEKGEKRTETRYGLLFGALKLEN